MSVNPSGRARGADASTAGSMREWWLRTLLVLSAPRAVFVALRNEDADDLSARSEPVLAITILAGMAFALATPTSGRLMDDSMYSPSIVAVSVFLAGGLYGFLAYWVVGGLLSRASTFLGSEGTYRRSRNVLAFAAVPVVLSLLAWPLKIAVYGSAPFHRGGADTGLGADVFDAVWVGACVWAGSLLVLGVRSVHGWSWARSLLAAAVPIALVGGLLVWSGIRPG